LGGTLPQALQGYRIADFSHVVAGPLATHFLRLLGAEVIKIESPRGDALRNYTLDPAERGMAPAFVGINAGKKSVVLDLKKDDELRVARRLVESADVLVENFRPGVIDKLGLGYAAVKTLKPSIVYCSVSGFGQNGPLRDHAAIDQVVQSVSGLMTLSGEPGSGPMRIGFPLVDTFSGLLAAFAIVAAVLQRERGHCEGQYIDLAMLDAAFVMMMSVVNPYLINGATPEKTGNLGFSRAPTADTFTTREGAITIGVVEQNQFERLCRAIGRDDMLSDPRFVDPHARRAHAEILRGELLAAFHTRDAEEWSRILNQHGVPAGVVRTVDDAVDKLLGDDRGLKLEIPLADSERAFATILNAGFLCAFDGPGVAAPAPVLGQHTEQLLAEVGR
jgi:CoA:oxalate CoA-transferase